jgi:Glu-tRNA(Gln) amidotransferase subunit E-like FAD-binding protein
MENTNDQHKPHEIVASLVAMVKDGQLNQDGIKPILQAVFKDDEVIMAALEGANETVDPEMVDTIINELRAESR